MMQDGKILTAIDVGTYKVCTIVAKTNGDGSFAVVAHSVVRSEGMKKGNVADVSAAEAAIRASVEEVRRKSGLSIHSAYVGVSGAHVSSENRKDALEWAGRHGVITAADVTRIPGSVASSIARPGRQVIHAIPISYSLDGKNGIRDPVGMHTRELEVETHVVTGASSFLDKLVAAVEKSGVRVESLVLEPLASSEAVLTPEEKEEGAAVVDIGGGTTDIAVFRNGSLVYTAVIPVGGYQFTNDICLTYDTPYSAAEEAKLKYGHTEPNGAQAREDISLPLADTTSEIKVPLRDICLLTRERAQELIRLIKLLLHEAKMGAASNIRVVLTGGTSRLPGLEALVQRILTNHVTIGIPRARGAIPEELQAPAYATSVGILIWAMNRDRQDTSLAAHTTTANGDRPETRRGGSISRILNKLRMTRRS